MGKHTKHTANANTEMAIDNSVVVVEPSNKKALWMSDTGVAVGVWEYRRAMQTVLDPLSKSQNISNQNSSNITSKNLLGIHWEFSGNSQCIFVYQSHSDTLEGVQTHNVHKNREHQRLQIGTFDIMHRIESKPVGLNVGDRVVLL